MLKKHDYSQRSSEFEGKTVKEAIAKALKELAVSKEDVVVRILCEEKRGLFGMQGEKPAKIRVDFKNKK